MDHTDLAASRWQQSMPHLMMCDQAANRAKHNDKGQLSHAAVEGVEKRLRELPDVSQVILAGLEASPVM
jgi:hypothetical protein